MFQKRIQGAIYGMMSPAEGVPRLLSLWRAGLLRLEDINEGYADLKAGRIVRGIIRYF
jgi:S-(hydroxymethyl)glutathione dehydrogenase/alcohol dehydrogenase